jgi:hypothetical protein
MLGNKFFFVSALLLVLTGCKSAEESNFVETCKAGLKYPLHDAEYKKTIIEVCSCASEKLQEEFEVRGLEEDESFRLITASIEKYDSSYLNQALSGSYQQAVRACDY